MRFSFALKKAFDDFRWRLKEERWPGSEGSIFFLAFDAFLRLLYWLRYPLHFLYPYCTERRCKKTN